MTPRWKLFIWQGAVLGLIGLVAAGLGDGPLGLAILIIGTLLLLAGLVGGAVNRDQT